MTTVADGWPKSAFWTFSLDLYGRPGVKEACLSLQDRRGLDVNIILWALWLGSSGKALDHVLLAEAETAIADFRREVVWPLRTARRHLRLVEGTSASSIKAISPVQQKRLGDRVAAAELDSEHVMQLALEGLSQDFERNHPAGAILAGANVSVIAVFREDDRGDLQVLISQAFEDLSPSDLDRVLAGMGL